LGVQDEDDDNINPLNTEGILRKFKKLIWTRPKVEGFKKICFAYRFS
jgi:hypothetical protein